MASEQQDPAVEGSSKDLPAAGEDTGSSSQSSNEMLIRLLRESIEHVEQDESHPVLYQASAALHEFIGRQQERLRMAAVAYEEQQQQQQQQENIANAGDNDNGDKAATTKPPPRKKMKKTKKSYPSMWRGTIDTVRGLINSKDEEAVLRLSVGWETGPDEEWLMEKCLKYVDPAMARLWDSDRETFDQEAAEKALRKDGLIDDIYKFTPEGKASHGFYWSVSSERKETFTTKGKALESLERLFDGDFCC